MSNKRQVGLLARLRAARQGASAAIFALAMPVMAGGLALGIDYSLCNMASSRMQTSVDGAALAAAMEIERGGDVTARALAYIAADAPRAFDGMTSAADVTLGIYDNQGGFRPDNSALANAVRVRAERSPDRGNAVNQLFSALFLDDVKTISVEAIAARPVNVFYQPPESKTLDPEAGDFNELYVYCFDTLGEGTPESRRSQMTLISNNMPVGQSIVAISGGRVAADPPASPVWPRCTRKGQTLSIRLRNIRHVKSNPVLWVNPAAIVGGVQPGRPERDYFTDTQLGNAVETFELQGFNILETVRCDNEAQCTPGSGSSIIPAGRNRQATRRRETQPCEPGKYMYFGFEDRPPGQAGANANWLQPAWTDSDYDDIRVVMRCPASGRLGDAFVRLVK